MTGLNYTLSSFHRHLFLKKKKFKRVFVYYEVDYQGGKGKKYQPEIVWPQWPSQ